VSEKRGRKVSVDEDLGTTRQGWASKSLNLSVTAGLKSEKCHERPTRIKLKDTKMRMPVERSIETWIGLANKYGKINASGINRGNQLSEYKREKLVG
jgi:hypothetical protein